MKLEDYPTFLFNKDTNVIVMLEETETGGIRISTHHHHRVIYEDREANSNTIHKFITIMEDLEDRGFEIIS